MYLGSQLNGSEWKKFARTSQFPSKGNKNNQKYYIGMYK